MNFELAYDKRKSAFDGNSADTYAAGQFNGNITGMMWRSVGDGEKRKYDFEYDAVNRLGKASFAEYSGTTWSNANANFNVHGFDSDNNYQIKYDDNGNLLSMIQHAMKPGTPDFYLDALRYYYEPGSNRLKRVTDDNPNPDSKLGDFKYDPNTKTATDYTYDVNGNLITDNNKKISSITYNHLNLPQTITVTGKGIITYTYDATGNKLKKEINEPASTGNNNTGTVTSTLYVGGFVYESKTVNSTAVYSHKLQFGGHEEGRIRTLYTNNSTPHTPTGFAYDYMLKDHLGNVRMVLTDELQTNIYPVASLEDATVSCENYFHAVDTSKTRSRSEIYDPNTVLGYANNNGFAAGPCGDGTGTNNQMYRLFATSVGADTGLSMTLKVMSGDVINIWGKSYYNDANTGGTNYSTTATQLIAGFLGGGLGGATASGHGATTSMLGSNAPTVNGLNSFITDPGRGSGTKPKAYINWILLDEQFKFVTGGFSRTDQNANTIYDHRFTDLTMSKNGYLYIYVSNESPVAVFFDNLQVTHTRGPVLEETHYYPFGLTMAGISSKATGKFENKHKYNDGTELNTDFDINLYETPFRGYDPQIGRFHQIDQMADDYEDWSPYNFGLNNPILYNDPTGLSPEDDKKKERKETSTEDNPTQVSEVVITASRKNSWNYRDWMFFADKNKQFSWSQLNEYLERDGVGDRGLNMFLQAYDGIGYRERKRKIDDNWAEAQEDFLVEGLQWVAGGLVVKTVGKAVSWGYRSYKIYKRAKAVKSVTVVGEGMARVEAAAAKIPGSQILNSMPKFTGTADQVTSQMMTYNRQWILQQMRSGRPILDIGRDLNRANPSIFYQMEQSMMKNYLKLHPNAFQIIKP